MIEGNHLDIFVKDKDRDNFYYVVLSGKRESEPFETTYVTETEEKVAVDRIVMPDGTVIERGTKYTLVKALSAYVDLKREWFSEHVKATDLKVIAPAGDLIGATTTIKIIGPATPPEGIQTTPGTKETATSTSPWGRWELRAANSLLPLARWVETSLGPADMFKLQLYLICEQSP